MRYTSRTPRTFHARCFGCQRHAPQALDSHPGSNFVVLLAHTKLLAFKALYVCSSEEDGPAERLFGLGPPQVDATMVCGGFVVNYFSKCHPRSL